MKQVITKSERFQQAWFHPEHLKKRFDEVKINWELYDKYIECKNKLRNQHQKSYLSENLESGI